jgi:hypothetical protein
MILDRPQIAEGSVIVNATVPSGASFPGSPNPGELFYLTSGSTGLYAYNEHTSWVQVFDGAACRSALHAS